MTRTEIEEYIKAYDRDRYQCVCGKRAVMIGHCLDRTLVNIKKFGKEVIQNHNNLRAVCSLSCNTVVRVSKENEREILFNLIKDNLNNILPVEYINKKIKEE